MPPLASYYQSRKLVLVAADLFPGRPREVTAIVRMARVDSTSDEALLNVEKADGCHDPASGRLSHNTSIGPLRSETGATESDAQTEKWN